ncbi:MAG: type IV pilus assembly protein PilM [bacterium]
MSYSFSNIFKSFLNSKEESVFGVDIGSASIKIVQLKKKKGKAVLETYGELALGPYGGFQTGQATNLPPEKIIEALKDVMKESNITTKNCGFAIPIKSSMVFTIEMPMFSEKQLNQMVPIEARKYIPVPISEVTLDWFVIPTAEDIPDTSSPDLPKEGVVEEKQKKVQVLIVAIHNDVLTRSSNIVSGAQLEAGFFEIEMFSTARAVLDQDAEPVMIFDMGAGGTKLYIIERGVIRNSHIISKGSQDLTLSIASALGVPTDQAEKLKINFGGNLPEEDKQIIDIVGLVIDPILSEVNTVLLNYERKYNKNVAKVLLSGGGVALNGFAEYASKKLNTKVSLALPFSKVETPAFLNDVLKRTGVSFSVAMGVAMRRLQEIQ